MIGALFMKSRGLWLRKTLSNIIAILDLVKKYYKQMFNAYHILILSPINLFLNTAELIIL